MALPPYSFSTVFAYWRFDPVIASVLVVVAMGYAGGFLRARHHGAELPWWRLFAFVVLGLGSIVLCTMSSLAVYQHTDLWAFAVQMTLMMSIVPVLLALGDPLQVVRMAGGDRWQSWWGRALSSWVVRVLTFPLFAAILGAVVQMYIYFGPLLGAALHSQTVMNETYLLVLAVGSLLALPLLGAEVLPAWCTEPFRLLFAVLDGLFDAIPGIAVMTSGALLASGYFRSRFAFAEDALHSQHVAGALVLALAEVVTLPLLVVLFLRWASVENALARPRRTPREDGSAIPITEELTQVERPWWETEGGPRRTDEYHGR